MEGEEIIGILAGVLTTIAAIPQIIKAWKSKQVDDVSPWMFIVLILGVSLWTVYGIIKVDYPIIFTNALSVIFNTMMLLIILKYRK